MQRTYKINSLWSYECERCPRSFPTEESSRCSLEDRSHNRR